jgi:hypothetical protein
MAHVAVIHFLMHTWLRERSVPGRELNETSATDAAMPCIAPTGLRFEALGEGRVQLRWRRCLHAAGRYLVQQWTATVGWADVAVVPGYRSRYIGEGLTPHTVCALRVVVHDGEGCAFPSAAARVRVR